MKAHNNSTAEQSLVASVRAGDLAAVLALLRQGSAVDQRDPEGLSPLLIASGLGQPQMVEILLTAGADPLLVEPRMGATALHKAAQAGNPDVIEHLLRHGAFIDQQSPILGNTPLMDAVSYKNEKAVERLLARGCRLTARNHWQQTALDIAQHDGLTNIARMLQARNEQDHAQVAGQELIAAIKAGDGTEVARLIAAGADVNQRVPATGGVDDDYTPLGIAAREGHAVIVGLLLDAGADVRRVIGLMRGTPVHEASYFGHVNVLQVMLEKSGQDTLLPKPELDAQGPYNGLTALHDAIWHGHAGVARLLVAAGARLDVKSHTGHTPKESALFYHYHDLAHFLTNAEVTHHVASQQ